jgi:hypothetical protein
MCVWSLHLSKALLFWVIHVQLSIALVQVQIRPVADKGSQDASPVYVTSKFLETLKCLV